MSVFTEDFAASGWLDLLAHFDDSASYTPSGGSATPITIIAENLEAGDDQGDDRLVRKTSLKFQFNKSDVGGTVTPEVDTIVFDGVTYLVMTIEKEVGDIVVAIAQDIDTVAIQSDEREYRRG